jgi:hypothetical protein
MAQSPLDRAWYLARQAAAGAALPFMDNPSIQGQPEAAGLKGYSPIALDAVAAPVYQLYNMGAPHVGLPKFQNDYLDRATVRVDEASNTLNKNLGIKDPSDPWEVAANAVGGVLLPGSSLRDARTAAVAAKAARAARMAAATTKTAKVLNVARNIATGTAKTAAEMVVPLRQGAKLSHVAPIVAGASVGAHEAIDAAMPSDAYTGIVDQYRPPDVDINTVMTPQISKQLDDAQAAGDWDTYKDITDSLEYEAKQQHSTPQEAPWKSPLLTTAALTAAIGGVYATSATLRNMAKTKFADTLTGKVAPEGTTSFGTKVVAGLAQGDQPVRAALTTVHGKGTQPLAVDLAKLDGITAPAMHTKITHAAMTGELPNSGLKTQPLGATLNAFAKDVSPDEWTVVSDGLLAKSALEDAKLNKTLASFRDVIDPTTGAAAADSATAVRILEGKAAVLDSDPKLAAYGRQVQQHYRDIVDYWQERGLISSEMHTELTTKRPAYVHFAQNRSAKELGQTFFSSGYSSPTATRLGELMARGTEEGSGIKAGEAADPIRMLPGQFERAIRAAELNSTRVEVLDVLSRNQALKDVVKEVPPGTAVGEGHVVHKVYENGVEKTYVVKDRALGDALALTPNFARSGFAQALGAFNKPFMQMTTGLGAPAFAIKSSTYDVLTGMLNRPKFSQMGWANEGLNYLKIGQGPIGQQVRGALSIADPTSWFSAPLGAIRSAVDDMPRAVAHDLTEQLIRGDGLMVKALGPAQTEVLRDSMAAWYHTTIKSRAEQLGALNASIMQATNPSDLAHGIIDIAPKFATAASERAYKEAVTGLPGSINNTVMATLEGSKNNFVKVRASAIARLYSATVRSLNDGARYSYFATNLPKAVSDDELKVLASETRRLASDPGQRGGSALVNDANAMATYLNVGIQDMAQTAKMFKDQPVTTATNMIGVLGALAILKYTHAAASPEAIPGMVAMSDDQKVRTVPTHGGLYIPIPPLLQVPWALVQAQLDEIVGLNHGQFNPDFADAFDSWLADDTKMSEEGDMSLKTQLSSALQSAAPINSASNPMYNAYAAMALGQDQGFTRFTGAPQEIRQQGISQIGGEGALMDSSVSARAQTAIGALLGTTVAAWLQATVDGERAIAGGASWPEGLKVSLQRMGDNSIKALGPVKGTLFGNYETVNSVNTTGFKLWQAKKDGLELATKTLNQDVLGKATTGLDPRYAQLRDIDFVRPELRQTALAPIGMAAKSLTTALRPLQMEMNVLTQQATQNVPNQKFSSAQAKNHSLNELTEKRKALAERMTLMTKMAEERVRKDIGEDSFTFQNFNPKHYEKMPWGGPPQSTAPPVPASQ